MTKRVYQAWKGSNIFIFQGRLIFGPDARSLIVTCLLIIAPVIIFCSLVARKLLHRFSSNNAGYAILVVTIVYTIWVPNCDYRAQRLSQTPTCLHTWVTIAAPFLAFHFLTKFHLTMKVLVLLLLTSARDPGIVPRNSHPPEEDIHYESSVDASGRPTPSLQLPRTKEVFVNGLPVRIKYCDTCMLYRPPRCSHCSICDNCVERFDHHCPWVGQCIGKRNYRFFFMFISSSALLCIFVFSMSALNLKFLVDDFGTVWKAMGKSPASVILMAFCFISLWFVGGLTGFHLYLSGTNQTTYENFRDRASNRFSIAERRNVYDRGCWNNLNEVFCTKIEPSRNKFRANVQEDVPRPMKGPLRDPELNDVSESRRAKVEDGMDITDDILKASQRRNFEGVGDVRNRGSEGVPRRPQDVESGLGF